MHHATTAARNALEVKYYCYAVFLDVSWTFDKVWIDGLIRKINQYFPYQFVKILESYFYFCRFQVHYDEGISSIKSLDAGIP